MDKDWYLGVDKTDVLTNWKLDLIWLVDDNKLLFQKDNKELELEFILLDWVIWLVVVVDWLVESELDDVIVDVLLVTVEGFYFIEFILLFIILLFWFVFIVLPIMSLLFEAWLFRWVETYVFVIFLSIIGWD